MAAARRTDDLHGESGGEFIEMPSTINTAEVAVAVVALGARGPVEHEGGRGERGDDGEARRDLQEGAPRRRAHGARVEHRGVVVPKDVGGDSLRKCGGGGRSEWGREERRPKGERSTAKAAVEHRGAVVPDVGVDSLWWAIRSEARR